MTRSETALKRYEQRTGVPLLVVSICYLALVFVEFLPDVRMGPLLVFIDGAFWVVFLLDWAYRVFWLAPNRLRYALTPLCILDFIVVLSFPVLLVLGSPSLGLARVARVVVQVVRLLRGGAQAARTAGQAKRVWSRQSLRWLVPVGLLLVVLAAIVTWRYETASPDASIQSWADAAWWTVVTLMTVGYGDLYPKTPEGRIAGVVVMIVGITLFGWVTATLASVFVEGDEKIDREDMLAHLDEHLDQLSERLAALEAKLDGRADIAEDGHVPRHKPAAIVDHEDRSG
jgi:voltage-gated potassium channel